MLIAKNKTSLALPAFDYFTLVFTKNWGWIKLSLPFQYGCLTNVFTILRIRYLSRYLQYCNIVGFVKIIFVFSKASYYSIIVEWPCFLSKICYRHLMGCKETDNVVIRYTLQHKKVFRIITCLQNCWRRCFP